MPDLTQAVRIAILAAMPMERLTRGRMIEALNLLGLLAEQEDLTLELCIYGGGAMMPAYSARESTKDLDVTAKPGASALRLAGIVAQRLGLDEGWLNNDVSRFVSIEGTFAPLEIDGLETAARHRLKITRPSASYPLAMKCLAGRSALPGHPGDVGDIEFLIRKMGLRSVEQVEEHLQRFYPQETLPPRLQEIILGILEKDPSA